MGAVAEDLGAARNHGREGFLMGSHHHDLSPGPGWQPVQYQCPKAGICTAACRHREPHDWDRTCLSTTCPSCRPLEATESAQDRRTDTAPAQSPAGGEKKAGGERMKFEIEIDPVLLTRDGQEFEPVAFRVAGLAEWAVAAEGRIQQMAGHDRIPRLILRPKKWAPTEGEECLFLNFGRPGRLAEDRWDGDNPWHAQALAAGACWPLSRRAEAEACVERVRKAIGGAK